jgi:hypothetical protein
VENTALLERAKISALTFVYCNVPSAFVVTRPVSHTGRHERDLEDARRERTQLHDPSCPAWFLSVCVCVSVSGCGVPNVFLMSVSVSLCPHLSPFLCPCALLVLPPCSICFFPLCLFLLPSCPPKGAELGIYVCVCVCVCVCVLPSMTFLKARTNCSRKTRALTHTHIHEHRQTRAHTDTNTHSYTPRVHLRLQAGTTCLSLLCAKIPKRSERECMCIFLCVCKYQTQARRQSV